MRRHPTAPVNVARISVATSGADFTAPEAVFRSAHPGCGLRPGDHFCHVGAAGVGIAPGPLLADFVAEIGIPTARDGWCIF